MSDVKGEGDGVALTSVNHPLLITPEMVKAGEQAFAAMWDPTKTPADMVKAVYTAMTYAHPPEPEDLNEESLEQALLEIDLYAEIVERFAIRCAVGADEDVWPAECTEEHKTHWRQFVRDLAAEIDEAPRRVRLAKSLDELPG